MILNEFRFRQTFSHDAVNLVDLRCFSAYCFCMFHSFIVHQLPAASLVYQLLYVHYATPPFVQTRPGRGAAAGQRGGGTARQHPDVLARPACLGLNSVAASSIT